MRLLINDICYDKNNVSLPTVETDSIFLTGVVDAHEGGPVVILEVVKAFLHADNGTYVLMLLCGKLAEPLVKVDATIYRKYVTTLKK